MTTTIELDRTALETEYRALMGLRNWDKVDRRWSAKRLAKEVADRKALNAEAAARKAAEEAAVMNGSTKSGPAPTRAA